MAIYSKSTRELMREFVEVNQIKKGQVISRNEIISWFSSNYPKIKQGTITAHIIRMSTNAPSRIHLNVNQKGDDDLFYQIDSKRFRLFEPENDPEPIYTRDKSINDDLGDDESIEAEEIHQTGFAYESDLRDFLARNLHLVEPGLHLYEEENITGIEFPVGGRFVDILAKDANNNYVVIELKVSRGYDRTVGQLLRYMSWIEKNLAEPTEKVRGIIIAREITNDLRLATYKINDVELFEYELSVTLRNIEK